MSQLELNEAINKLLDEKLERRQPLVDARNKILDSIWWQLPWNVKKVKAIDSELDKLDLEFYREIKKLRSDIV